MPNCLVVTEVQQGLQRRKPGELGLSAGQGQGRLPGAPSLGMGCLEGKGLFLWDLQSVQ